MTDKQKIIVIGNGMVGQHFLQNLADSNQTQNFDITVLCEEPRAAYDRVQLTSYFTKGSEALNLVSDGFFEQHNIALKLNCRASKIDRVGKTVTTLEGDVLAFDKLVLATGSVPFVPPVPGHDREHCHVYRTIEDLEAIKKSAQGSKVGVVIGGGLLGLEAAKALHELGLETHVVEFSDRLMAVQLDDAGGALLKAKIEKLGVTVHTAKNTQAIQDGESQVHRMVFGDGSVLETDLIVFGAGIRPQDSLARDCDLALGPNGGVKINNLCQTSDPAIYAVGECAAWNGKVFGLVAPGYLMAKAAAQGISQSGYAQFKGSHTSTKLKLLGVDVASIGDSHGRVPGAISYSYFDGSRGVYKKVVISADKTRVIGAVLVGDASDYDNLLNMALTRAALPAQPEALILPAIVGVKPVNPAAALANNAKVCGCHDVSKATIVRAVQDGAKTLADVKTVTKASTGCGGCTNMVTNILELELATKKVAPAKKIFDPATVDDSVKICFCHKVSKGEIAQAVKSGAKDLDGVKAATKAATGCGGCKVKVNKIVEHELANLITNAVAEKAKVEIASNDRVCFCHMVSKGEICDAVQAGAQDLAAVKGATKASTGCGGCTDKVVDIMRAELEKVAEVVS